jgi:hypothetical protein
MGWEAAQRRSALGGNIRSQSVIRVRSRAVIASALLLSFDAQLPHIVLPKYRQATHRQRHGQGRRPGVPLAPDTGECVCGTIATELAFANVGAACHGGCAAI